MRLVLLLLVALLVVTCRCDVQVSVDSATGEYRVRVGDQVWLRSTRTALYADERWYSSDDGSLPLIDTQLVRGTDPYLGDWNETQLIYQLTRSGTITFHLEVGDEPLTSSTSLSEDEVRTVFPSFNIKQIDANDHCGYFTYADLMMGDLSKPAGVWNASAKIITSSLKGGPVVVFNSTSRGQGDAVVLSPFSRFMATSMHQEGEVLEYGVMGSMLSVPAQCNHSMILFYSPRGVNAAMREWGQCMQRAFNRTSEHRLNDLTVKYLGYYTNNGGYYYYNTKTGMNYEETIVSVSRELPLPIHYMQIDSWWSYKGTGDGVSQWTARPEIFPDGLSAVYRRMENIPMAAHNRYWAANTSYAEKYSFVIDSLHGKALPVSKTG